MDQQGNATNRLPAKEGMIILKNIFTGKQHFIFDFDGTIADSFALHEYAFQQALANYDLQFAYKDYLGMSTDATIARIFNANEKEINAATLAELVAAKRSFANKAYKQSLQPIPGALDFIHLLHAHQLPMYVASSGSRMNVLAGIAALQIGHYFKAVFTAEDVTHAKPDPEIFLNVIKQFAIDPATAIVIEDALSGIEAARAAGIDVVCVNAEIEQTGSNHISLSSLSFNELITLFESSLPNEESTGRSSNL